MQQASQVTAKADGGCLIGEVQGKRRLVMIGAMQEEDSQTNAGGGQTLGRNAYADMARRIKDWGQELGFAAIGIAGADVSALSLIHI